MWKPSKTGHAIWTNKQGDAWFLDAGGQKGGIRIGTTSDRESVIELLPVDNVAFPTATEHFVRGDQWHVIYSQGECDFALRVVFRPIQSTEGRLMIELIIALQTSLLDTHPTIDLCAHGENVITLDPSGDGATSTGCAPMTITQSNASNVAVLLGPHDYPFTKNLSSDGDIRLRLFGDFLEKGVIRKARPWLAIGEYSQAELNDAFDQLAESPLPLTP